MLCLFCQLPVAKYPWIQLAANPPRRMEFHDESSNVSSLGSATADIAWRPDLPL
ncbi:uncharacterized protein LACBIDRAFT_298845 [Laccaria bicolor S238N-H82]|uniref:Predicted protein n=1 Tax=Laccaria bicolor (strain S238N-H82 / ATCC MYA-4686) TaxID=486041 RepID=B0E3K0_LACBS|nr:uncharacterized protein LACBIDRAFT_298845 [Laccaria bicolor S238N-H82]EDQ98579.1 predicted protein [Laccaria bicolor S238N-H82]|eukprot:XP_001890768.1 predicted protein [Laccaria bicolor S238N-H82]